MSAPTFYTMRSHQRVYSSTFRDHVPATDFRFGWIVVPFSGVRIAQSAKDPRLAGRNCAERRRAPDRGTAARVPRETVEGPRGGSRGREREVRRYSEQSGEHRGRAGESSGGKKRTTDEASRERGRNCRIAESH